jgi:hypothetical protein
MDEKSYIAVVQKIFPKGPHGPYAKASSEKLGQDITFSLNPPIWREKFFPEEGTYVVLSELTRKRAGWRANLGRFLQPDEERLITREDKEK